MSISSVVDWWEEWQLRVLVLGSLAIQLYLAVIAPFRKLTGLNRLNRLLIWVSYLGGDALAIYALATLFNRQKRLQHHASSSVMNGSHDLEVLWAPILLMHLGGRMTISAYNMEDNELWLRHVGVAISQVTVTVYVFWTTWSPSADKRLFIAAIVLFVLGIVRCFEKPLALKRASFNNLVTYFVPASIEEISTKKEVELEKYIQDAKLFYVQRNNNQHDDFTQTLPEADKKFHTAPNKMFVDYAYAYNDRVKVLKSLRLLDTESAFKALREGLSKTFDPVYTKIWRHGDDENRSKSSSTFVDKLSMILMGITMTFPVASIVLFQISHKEAYRGIDIKVTYILLYITYFSELISVPARLNISSSSFQIWSWSGSLFHLVSAIVWHLVRLPPFPFVMVQQHNLIGVLEAKENSFVASIPGCGECCGCQDMLQQRWFGRSKLYRKGKEITSLIITHAEDAWINSIEDVESYWNLCDSRGHWTLERNQCQEMVILWDSLEKPFDHSVLLWHLATDLCFHCKGASVDADPASLFISNYMMYLLCANTEMLLPGSRTSLFKDACKQLNAILKGEDDKHLTLTEKVISKALKSEKGYLHDAWVLAQELMQLPGGADADADDDEWNKMWKVIKGVWVEMLCFSAGRCRGYLHAKILAYGGELLTYVALLMSNAGLETFADRQQRMKLRFSKEDRLKLAKRTQQESGNQAAGMVVEIQRENTATPSTSTATTQAVEVVVVEAV
ncbi:unnamed protein product [Urochloa decumbens]|uniref:DUF4220 domain-containing protein n=1 Tax=Urochloa decumbens TaxID=240449 RepID=A0ABC9BKW6_9POAL